MRRGLAILGAVAANAGVGAAAAQSPAPANWPDARPADAGVSDVDPLAESLRLEPIDLRVNASFDRVFEYGTEASNGASRELFGRSDGGVTAVFPRSDYAYDRFGRYATIPADTMFVIGGPPGWLLDRLAIETPAFARPGLTPSGFSNRIDASLDLRIALPGFEAGDAQHTLPNGSSMTVGGVRGELNRRTVRILMRWATEEALKRQEAPAEPPEDAESAEGELPHSGSESESERADATEPATADR